MKKLKSIYKFLKTPIVSVYKDGNFRRGIKYREDLGKTLLEDTILYESFHGKGLTDSPFAIFKYMLKEDKYKKYKHVWAVSKKEQEMMRGYERYSNVKFVEVHSREYLKYLAQSKYLINNTSFPPYFIKRADQIYINTWHGTPLKYLGKDVKTAARSYSCNLVKNFIAADYLIHQNKYTTEIFNRTYDLQDIYPGNIIDIGYPRTDSILNTNTDYIKGELEKLNIKADKKLVLYAPTWRGLVGKVEANMERMVNDLTVLKNRLGEEYKLIVKVHTLQYKYIKDNETLQDIGLIPDYMDINEIMSVVDVLITDYSSVFFDFLVTGKPILYYMYDKEQYFETVGSYIDLEKEKLPGPICLDMETLMSELDKLDTYELNYGQVYRQYQNKYCSNLEGNNTQRIVDYIFNNNPTLEVSSCYAAHKKHILIYAGGFLNNGITTSAINLMNHIDYDKYTVTFIESNAKNNIREENLKQLNPNVKVLFRNGQTNHKFLEAYQNRWILRMGMYKDYDQKAFPKELYENEYRRIFGNLKFDIAIDYSGYVPFWSLIFSQCSAIKSAYIYQHNDMFAEYNKVINKKLKHRDNLNLIFSIYKDFKAVVSVSKLTMELNKENLKPYCNTDNFTYINNVLDVDKIMNYKDQCNEVIINDKEYIITTEVKDSIRMNLGVIEKLDSNLINLVTIGRLSPEKDHKKLINAFNEISEVYDHLRLYIIGDGVEKEALVSQIRSLGLENKVILTGQLSNPFYFLNQADAFVLSSNHEGQPMVLLEALSLNKKIIATDIQANIDVLQGGLGELVENSVEGLVEGIRKLVNNEIPDYEFNPIQYNKNAFKLIEERILQGGE